MDSRSLEFHFGAITHQHMLSMANATHMGDLKTLAGAPIRGTARSMMEATFSGKAVGKTAFNVNPKINKPVIGTEMYN